MYPTKTSLLALISLAVPPLAHAATALTLQEAVSEALKESPVAQESDARASAAEWHYVSSRSVLLPQLDVVARHSFDTKYETLPFTAGPISASVPIAFPHTAYGLELHWLLFDGLSGWNSTAAASHKEDSANALRTRRRFEVRKKSSCSTTPCWKRFR